MNENLEGKNVDDRNRSIGNLDITIISPNFKITVINVF